MPRVSGRDTSSESSADRRLVRFTRGDGRFYFCLVFRFEIVSRPGFVSSKNRDLVSLQFNQQANRLGDYFGNRFLTSFSISRN